MDYEVMMIQVNGERETMHCENKKYRLNKIDRL